MQAVVSRRLARHFSGVLRVQRAAPAYGSVPWIGISRYCVRSASAHGCSGPPDGYVGVLGLLGA